jgi:hypothetical protein
MNKEIEKCVKEYEEDCSCVSPLSKRGIKIRNRLVCTFYKRPNDFDVQKAFNGSLMSFYSLTGCQNATEYDDISEETESNESIGKNNESTRKKDDDLKFTVNDYETSTQSEFEVVTDLRSNEKPDSKYSASNSNGEVARTPKPPNSSEAETSTNSTTDANEDLINGTENPNNSKVPSTTDSNEDLINGTDNPNNSEVSSMPNFPEAEPTRNSTTNSTEDSNGGIDNQTLFIVSAVFIVLLISVACLFYWLKDRCYGRYNLVQRDPDSNMGEIEMKNGTLTTENLTNEEEMV